MCTLLSVFFLKSCFCSQTPIQLHTFMLHISCLCLSVSVSLSGVLDPSLKAALESFSSKRRYEFWSDYVRDLVCVACDGEEEGLRSLSESQMLISAWRTLLILSTSHVSSHSTSHASQCECSYTAGTVFIITNNQSCMCVCL